MDFLNNINYALDYIEAHLDDDIDYGELAKIAQCSPFHFQRIFTYTTGVPLSEYVRRRRLSKAALELQCSDTKIIDIAIKYGYSSDIAFSRAFRALNGVSPSEARKSKGTLKLFPRLAVQLSVKGVEAIDYQVVVKSAFKMIGIKEAVTMKDNMNLKRIPLIWEELTERHFFEIAKYSKEQPQYVYGVCGNFREEDFDYYIATICDMNIQPPNDMEEILVPASTWGVFKCTGALPDAHQDIWKKIVTEWFPFSGYEPTGGPELEWYSVGDTSSSDYKSEVWISIERIR